MTRVMIIDLDSDALRRALVKHLCASDHPIEGSHKINKVLAALAEVSEPFHLEPGDQVLRRSDLKEAVRQLVAETTSEPRAGMYARVCDVCLSACGAMTFAVPPRSPEHVGMHTDANGAPCPHRLGHWAKIPGTG